MRFFLAIWVVIHHLTGRGMMLESFAGSMPAAAQSLLRAGYLAVGTFFVLSGFVLARGYSAVSWNRGNLAHYGAARFARIYPVYALSLLGVAPFVFADRLPWFGAKGVLAANYLLLLQGWTGTLPVHWNTPAWSLSCEVFFYLCFPPAGLLLRRLNGFGAVAAAAALCVIPAGLRQLGVPDTCKPVLHLSDFLMGILAARGFAFLSERERFVGRGQWLYLPALAATGALIVFPWVVPDWISLNSALRPANALLLIGLALEGGAVARLLSLPPVVYLGKASYALYILHIPFLWWYKGCVFHLYGIVPGALLALVYAVFVVAVSAAVFHYFEEPANAYLRLRLSGRPARIRFPSMDNLGSRAKRLRQAVLRAKAQNPFARAAQRNAMADGDVERVYAVAGPQGGSDDFTAVD
ncbi:MAG: acyltransferase [Rhodospirillales bacterium]|nr:acyltransferase [Rhodospirillales bacterium]